MGRQVAADMAAHSDSIEQAIRWHFSGNCYPSIPAKMVPVALKAIAAWNQDRNLGKKIRLPEGVEFQGRKSVTALEAIEGLHLDAFVDSDDGYYY